ncbi:hypothetical protein GCM10010517_16620 [Streptosporangium fragile]|uniref:Uncharacterized protein n=1 Tax=Streptosporangium fragile TaxID=46186 RepID=A0ABP6I9G0_9ACTN
MPLSGDSEPWNLGDAPVDRSARVHPSIIAPGTDISRRPGSRLRGRSSWCRKIREAIFAVREGPAPVEDLDAGAVCSATTGERLAATAAIRVLRLTPPPPTPPPTPPTTSEEAGKVVIFWNGGAGGRERPVQVTGRVPPAGRR